MANSIFSSSLVNPHFSQPILLGFNTHLSIPKAFYSKHLEGREEGKEAELRSDGSEITWKIKIDGHRLTKGWEKFAVAHNLRVGDILVFRHEGNLMFHVIPLGPSCCEILYSQEDEYNVNDKNGKLIVKKNRKKECSSSDSDNNFVVPVTASNLQLDSFYLPRGFTTSNGLSKLSNEVIVMSEKGRSSTLEVKYDKSSNRFCVKRGWRAFCCKNGHRTGCLLRLIFVRNRTKPILDFSFGQHWGTFFYPGKHSTKKNNREVEHVSAKEEKNVESLSLPDNSSFMIDVTVYNLRDDRVYLPRGLTTSIGLSKLCNEIILIDEKGRSSTLEVSYYKSCDRFRVKRGWRAFCCMHGHKSGCSLRLISVRNGTKPIIRIFPLATDVDDIGKHSKKKRDNPQVEHVSVKEKKKLESLCFVVSVTVSNLRDNRLYLPMKISRSSILNEGFHEIILMDKHGRKWTLSLSCNKSSGQFFISHGWRSFCEANGQKDRCSFLFKLVRNRTAPLLIMTSEDSTSEQLIETLA